MDFRTPEARDVLSVAEAITWNRRDSARLHTGYRFLLALVFFVLSFEAHPVGERMMVCGLLGLAALVAGVDSYLEWRRTASEGAEIAEFRSDLS